MHFGVRSKTRFNLRSIAKRNLIAVNIVTYVESISRENIPVQILCTPIQMGLFCEDADQCLSGMKYMNTLMHSW